MHNFIEDTELEREDATRQADCLSKAVKQLQDQKIRRDEFDDKRIQAHLSKSLDLLERDLDKRLGSIMDHI